MPTLGDTLSTTAVALADLTDVDPAATPRIGRLGLGVAAGATARITLPASTGLAAGLDFGGDLSVTREGAGVLRVARPTTALTALELYGAAGQNAQLRLGDLTNTDRWRFQYSASDQSAQIRDVAGGRNIISFSSTGRLFLQTTPDVTVGADAQLVAYAPVAAWDGGSGDGAGSSSSRGRIRFGFEALGGFTNTTNGVRGDPVTGTAPLGLGASAFFPHSIVIPNWNAKGMLVPFRAVIAAVSKPTGATYPDTYAECVPFVSRIGTVSSKGTYVGNWESGLTIGATGDGGPVQGFASLLQVAENNTYLSYDDGAIFGAVGTGSYRQTGARGVWIESSGAQPLGTGILMKGGGGFKRAIVLLGAGSVDAFCVDGTGNIGVRRATAQTTTLLAALTVGYDAAGSLSTSTADGVHFGDSFLYRVGTQTVQITHGFQVGTTFRHLGASLGFYNVTPVARASIGAAATDAATTQTLVNNIRTALNNLGLTQT